MGTVILISVIKGTVILISVIKGTVILIARIKITVPLIVPLIGPRFKCSDPLIRTPSP